MAISSVTKGNVITTAKINEIITAANGAGVSLSVSGTTLYLKNGAGTNLSNVSVVAAALPAGTVVAFAGNSDVANFILCNGAAVSRTTYAKLFEAIGTIYGAGDGSTTFNLPNLEDRFIQGKWESGYYINAGLPNIMGKQTANISAYGSSCSGAFVKGGIAGYHSGSGGSDIGWADLNFNAFYSNSIYGTSTTVQPPALTMRYLIKY